MDCKSMDLMKNLFLHVISNFLDLNDQNKICTPEFVIGKAIHNKFLKT